MLNSLSGQCSGAQSPINCTLQGGSNLGLQQDISSWFSSGQARPPPPRARESRQGQSEGGGREQGWGSSRLPPASPMCRGPRPCLPAPLHWPRCEAWASPRSTPAPGVTLFSLLPSRADSSTLLWSLEGRGWAGRGRLLPALTFIISGSLGLLLSSFLRCRSRDWPWAPSVGPLQMSPQPGKPLGLTSCPPAGRWEAGREGGCRKGAAPST